METNQKTTTFRKLDVKIFDFHNKLNYNHPDIKSNCVKLLKYYVWKKMFFI